MHTPEHARKHTHTDTPYRDLRIYQLKKKKRIYQLKYKFAVP